MPSDRPCFCWSIFCKNLSIDSSDVNPNYFCEKNMLILKSSYIMHELEQPSVRPYFKNVDTLKVERSPTNDIPNFITTIRRQLKGSNRLTED